MQRIRPATATVALLTKDRSLGGDVAAAVEDETTRVAVHRTLPALLAAITDEVPDVVILDDAMRGDSAELMRPLRRRLPSLYIVSIRVSDEARAIELLHAGADDAISRDSAAMTAKLQAAARRARTVNAGARIALGDIVFDRENRRVWCAGKEVELTPHEYSVVDCMFWHAPRGVNIDTLADFVWGDDESANRRALVQTYMSYVRKKLSSSAQIAISFARDVGYAFSPKGGKREKA